MCQSKSKFFVLFFFIISFSLPAYTASLVPVCATKRPLRTCPKKRISFPIFPLNANGEALFEYKIDQGDLGDLSSEEAVAFTDNVLNNWSKESSLRFEKLDDGFVGQDIDRDNFRKFIDKPQGFNLIVWDDDGGIVDELIGRGARSFVLGFASVVKFRRKNKKILSIKEAQTLINGFLFKKSNLNVGQEELEAIFQTTILHEFAHMFGIDHTQGGNLEDFIERTGDFRDIPVMFPVSANPDIVLHQDDIAAVKLAYPKKEESGSFAQISGTLTQSGRAVTGANLVAYKVDEENPKLFSVASPADVDGLGRGNFLLPNLIPGDYVLFAEPLNKDFVGGSSIGFHESPAEFEPGFFNGSSSFLNLDFDQGITASKLIRLNQGDALSFNVDVESNPLIIPDNDGIDPSFIPGGNLFNSRVVKLNTVRSKIRNLKLVNLNPGKRLRLEISTDYPGLVAFSNEAPKFSKRSRLITVRFASLIRFAEKEEFSALNNFEEVELLLTIKDLDTGYTVIKRVILN